MLLILCFPASIFANICTVHVYLYKSICFIMMDLNSFVLILWPPYFHLLYIEVLTSESGLSFPIDVGENYKDSP